MADSGPPRAIFHSKSRLRRFPHFHSDAIIDVSRVHSAAQRGLKFPAFPRFRETARHSAGCFGGRVGWGSAGVCREQCSESAKLTLAEHLWYMCTALIRHFVNLHIVFTCFITWNCVFKIIFLCWCFEII